MGTGLYLHSNFAGGLRIVGLQTSVISKHGGRLNAETNDYRYAP